jgi:hypothetical protein
VEKKGVKVTETRHVYDDEGREISRDSKPLSESDPPKAAQPVQSPEKDEDVLLPDLPDWDSAYEPFEGEYSDLSDSDSDDEVSGDQEDGEATGKQGDAMVGATGTKEFADQGLASDGGLQAAAEESSPGFGGLEANAPAEERDSDGGEIAPGFEVLAGEPGHRAVLRTGRQITVSDKRVRSRESEGNGLGGSNGTAEKQPDVGAGKSGRASGETTERRRTAEDERKKAGGKTDGKRRAVKSAEEMGWGEERLKSTYLEEGEELGIDWGEEDYEDCFSDKDEDLDAETQDSDVRTASESKDPQDWDSMPKAEKKARLAAMAESFDQRLAKRKAEKEGKRSGSKVSESKAADSKVPDAEEEDSDGEEPSQAELKEWAKELEAALPKVSYKQMESMQPVLEEFGLENESLSELLMKPGFGGFMSDQLSKRSGVLMRREIKFPVAAVGKMLRDKGLRGRNIKEILASDKWAENRRKYEKELDVGVQEAGKSVTEEREQGQAAETSPASSESSPLETGPTLSAAPLETGTSPEESADPVLDENSSDLLRESEELKRQLGLSEASLDELFKDGLLNKEEVMENLKEQLDQFDSEEFWGTEPEPIPDDDIKPVLEMVRSVLFQGLRIFGFWSSSGNWCQRGFVGLAVFRWVVEQGGSGGVQKEHLNRFDLEEGVDQGKWSRIPSRMTMSSRSERNNRSKSFSGF